ncbi:MAG: DNA/RNA nuclease SfsA [Methanomassiliicoccaceae archaeon]|nr:DNA/RNA nuclease SfsA [Methanomassiliicoccaceae archaeon]
MIYPDTVSATFIERPNRFIAKVELDGEEVICHVKNTGRCREILVPGTKVILAHSDDSKRKTSYDLISAYKGDVLINIDSQAPNAVYAEAISLGRIYNGPTLVKREARHGDSRFDFYIEDNGRKIFAEVKGVTLEDNGKVLFPDAPTERGVKHLRGLAHCVSEGYSASSVFVVQMSEADYFVPNYEMHEEFGIALEEAVSAGVEVTAYTCEVSENSLHLAHRIPIKLRNGVTL